MKKTIFIVALFVGVSALAQEKVVVEKPHWKKGGSIILLGNQSSFLNWVAGGNNSVSATLGLNYNFNYAKDDITWDNKIIIQYGLSNTEGIGKRKTDDLFEYNSLLGKKASKYWYYSFFINLRSQFSDGFDYKKTPVIKTSSFFSPGYLTFGPGFLWKKSDNFKINLSPLTSKFTFVSNDFAGKYGTSPGKTSNYELGFYGSLYHKTNLMENVSMENILNVYSNYLKKPQNIDISHQLNIVMQINKYLTTNLSFHTIIDDDASKRVQFKEIFGLGINYIF